MYRIKNITNSKVILGDLQGIIIKKDEEIDLDVMFSRDIIDASKDLKKATDPKRRVIAIVHKDVMVKVEVPVPTPVSNTVIEEMVRKTIADMPQPKEQKPDTDHLQNKLDIIIAALGNQSRSEQSSEKIRHDGEQKSGHVNSDTSVDIQTRLLKRLSNNVQSHVEAKEEIKESSDVKRNADDLGDLLGGSL